VSAAVTRILIAGDDLESQESTAWFLRKEGYSVFNEVGLGGVLRSALLNCPDLIILEHGETGTCAEAVANTAQHHPDLRRIPLIVLSPVPESRLSAMDLITFHRPYNYARLLETISAVLGGGTPGRSQFQTTKRLRPVTGQHQDNSDANDD
jgi:response regulator RpfG family c-di-GMP phosphodiesterase